MGSFDESKHPRDHGKFAESAGDSSEAPKAGKKKFALTGATNDVDHSLERAKYHAARAKMHAEKAAAATNDLDRKKWALAAAVSQKHAERHAKLAEKYAKKDGSSLAKQKAEEARSNADKAKTSAKTAADIADHGGGISHSASAATPGNGTKAAFDARHPHRLDAPSEVSVHASPSGKITAADVDEAAHRDLTKAEYAKYKDAAKLTTKEKESISDYTADAYVKINGDKNTNGLRNPPPSEAMKLHIANLDSAIAKSEAPINMLVHRGVNGRAHMGDLKPGSTFGDQGYSSTSAVEGAAFKSKEVFLHIAVPKGHPALSIEKHSNVEDEKEILLPRGTKYRVLSTKEGKLFTYGQFEGKKQLHVYCEVVPQ